MRIIITSAMMILLLAGCDTATNGDVFGDSGSIWGKWGSDDDSGGVWGKDDEKPKDEKPKEVKTKEEPGCKFYGNCGKEGE